jgi:hypothetical protein
MKHSALEVRYGFYASSDSYAQMLVCWPLSVGAPSLTSEFCTASIAEAITAISGFSYFKVLTSFLCDSFIS